VEQNGLDACDLAIFSNQWAADIAVKAYKLDTRKIRVITYGANLLEIPDSIEMGQLIAARSQAEIRFVHVGLDWIRKGVDRAIETVGDLRTRGLNATLQIVGSEVPSDTSIPDFVSLAGKLPKSTNAGRARMSQILGESHVLILPTLAECAAVVLAEAGAFGVPVLASDVGGNASLVRQNVNGILLSPQATTAEWADAALRIVADRQTYERWAWQSFDFFRQELSWTRSVSRFAEEIRKLLERDDRSFIHTGATR
jgi:glycosyltransferase involved in cell wall biosynthesis